MHKPQSRSCRILAVSSPECEFSDCPKFLLRTVATSSIHCGLAIDRLTLRGRVDDSSHGFARADSRLRYLFPTKFVSSDFGKVFLGSDSTLVISASTGQTMRKYAALVSSDFAKVFFGFRLYARQTVRSEVPMSKPGVPEDDFAYWCGYDGSNFKSGQSSDRYRC